MTVATATDVANRIGRPLTPKETLQVTSLLEDTEAEIARLGAGAKLADPNWAPLIKKVSCAVVRRAARLPDDLRSIVPGDEQTGYANSTPPVTAGSVYLRREERRSLGLPLTGAARVTPQAPREDFDGPLRFTDWGDGWDTDCDDYQFVDWPY